MKYVIAVSGGVDSVVLLDMLAKRHPSDDLIVAHFEHGIRGEVSKDDARFVEKLSQKYGLRFKVGYGNLTKDASEAEARERRYGFLQGVAKEWGAKVVTAHHANDVIETIVINLIRGTGWRGLAVFGNKNVLRPLLGRTKMELYDYAIAHSLEWVEDETNHTDRYLRNRVRHLLSELPSSIEQELHSYHAAQVILAKDIDNEAKKLLARNEGSRYFFTMIPGNVALELLRLKTNASLTRPQLRQLHLAIKTARPGRIFEAGSGVRVIFDRDQFIVENSSEVL